MNLNSTIEENENFEHNIKQEPEKEFLCILPSYDSANAHEGDLVQVKQENKIQSKKTAKHQCKFCHRTVGNNQLLKQHEATHQKLQCKVCNRKFSPQSLENHMKRHQNEKTERKFECKICSQKFIENFRLIKHSSIHSKRFQCDLCGHFSASRKQNLIIHLTSHFLQDQYKCKFCRKLFDARESFRFHLRQAHGDPKNRNGLTEIDFSCGTCGKKFNDVNLRKQHEKSHGEKIQCPFCNEKCKPRFMPRHLKLHELKKLGKTFICDICGYENMDRCDFKFHLELHLNPEKGECNICRKKFSNTKALSIQMALREHKLAHEAPKTCPVCFKLIKPKSFAHHMKLHESKKNKKKLECKVCGMKFYLKSNLYSHMKSHNKGLECDMCDYRTGRKGNMKNHMLNHMKEKPFECEICQRGFFLRHRLNQHRTIHFHPFRCNLCPASFFLEKRLKSHVKTHKKPKIIKKSNRSTQTQKKTDTKSVSTRRNLLLMKLI